MYERPVHATSKLVALQYKHNAQVLKKAEEGRYRTNIPDLCLCLSSRRRSQFACEQVLRLCCSTRKKHPLEQVSMHVIRNAMDSNKMDKVECPIPGVAQDVRVWCAPSFDLGNAV